MTIIAIGKAYPLKARELETKKDQKGKTYKFTASAFAFTSHNRVRVYGQDKHEAWCTLDFKATQAPKWLKRGIRDVEEVQAKAS